jgi:hypothetical protein
MHWLAKLYHFSGKKATGQEKNEGKIETAEAIPDSYP